MAERPTYRLRFLDPKKRFPAMPEQPAGRSYGVVWKLFGEDQHESCYVVEFVGKSHVSLLGYVSVSGEVYKVDRPVCEAPLPNDPDMELVLDESDSSIGEIMVREANGAMRACAQTAGSPEGPMREQSDHETWNSTRALPYGEFMASMFLRYVIFANSESAIVNTADAGGLDEGMQNVVDKIKLVKLPEPVEVFLGFNTAPLPDAIETLLYRVDHAENPSGIERYAAALMSEIDLPRLRTIAAKSEMSLARIDRSKIFYLNFDRSLLDQDEIDMLLAVECRLNRLSGILERIGAGLVPTASSPSLEGCALFDAWHIAKTTNDVPRLLDTASSDNPWGKPGTVACQPGGEWDVRTRFARIVEALNVVTRLDYTYRANVAEGIMLVRFGQSVVDAMPQREYDAQDDAWRELDEDTRAIWAAEHDARVALTLAAACFASGARITRCYVQIAAPDGEQGEIVFSCITKKAFPLLRYRTRDIGVITHEKCSCGRTFVRMSKPMGRTDDMLIIRGVNVFPSQIETVLLNMGYSPNYQIVVDRVNNLDTIEVLVEMTEEAFSDVLTELSTKERALSENIKSLLGVAAKVRLVSPKSIKRSEGKAVRVIDNRKK